MTVRISARTAFEPDALVVCPSRLDLHTMEIPNPIVVVEVLSPSTAADDHGVKLDGYFSLQSVEHYLIIDPDRRVMIHHKRGRATRSKRAFCARASCGSIRRASRPTQRRFSRRVSARLQRRQEKREKGGAPSPSALSPAETDRTPSLGR